MPRSNLLKAEPNDINNMSDINIINVILDSNQDPGSSFLSMIDFYLLKRHIHHLRNALNERVFTLNELVHLRFSAMEISRLVQPKTLTAIQEGLFTLADLEGVDFSTISALSHPRCLQALREGRTSLDQLIGMELNTLLRANELDDYPRPTQSGMSR